MNEVVDKFLLARGKFMLQLHLRQPGFTYKGFGSLTSSKDSKRDLKHLIWTISIRTN